MLGSLTSIHSSWEMQSAPPAPPPDVPTNFTVDISASYAILNFTAPAGATSYTATATPTTNTYEVVVSRTFTSGTGYKLEVLSSQTTYTFSLVATNNSGSSAAATVSATTQTASVQASPMISLTTLSTFDISAQNATAYNHIASPKTTPNIIYASFHNAGTFSSSRLVLFYSDNSGSSFTNIASRLKWYSNDTTPQTTADTICADVACSDDGKYVYVQPYYRWLNISTDYGVNFNYTKSTSSNSSAAVALSTNPTGEAVILAGQGATSYGGTLNYEVHWSNNYNSTYTYRDVSAGNNAAAINPATNYIYYSTGATNNILSYYNAGTKSNLLSFNFNTATFSTVSMGVICGIVSKGGLTFVACTTVPKLRKSTDGSTFTNVAAFNTGGIAANATMSTAAWIVVEPYVGFVLVCSKDNPAQIYYSKDSGTNWTQLTSPNVPSITGASAGTCVLQDSNVVVTIMVTNNIGTSNFRVTFYRLYFSVDIV